MSAEPLKRCSRCREEKPCSAFYRDTSKPDGRKPSCKACLKDGDRERYRRWREENPEKAREQARRWHEAHPEKACEKARRWYEENPEKARENARRRVASGRHAGDKRRRRERLAARTPEQILADQRRLRPDGLKKCRSGHVIPLAAFSSDRTQADGLNSECRSCSGDAFIDAAMPSIERRDTWLCAYCGEAPAEHGDHVEPKARGGVDDVENLIGACSACNLSKSARDLFEWRPDLLAVVASWPCVVRLVSAA